VPALPYPYADLAALFDVEPFRQLPRRHAVARRAAQATVVLGSTQRTEVIDTERARAMGIAVVRRRGGGGAVLLRPGDHLWVEAWIPRDDPLWAADVAEAAGWVGEWWSDALGPHGAGDRSVQRGRSVPGRHGALVCFSGRGPGELFVGDRKIMGVSQWRGREGSLFHTCAYAHWDPLPLIEVLHVDEPTLGSLQRELPGSAVGILDVEPGAPDLSALSETLLRTFPTWEKTGTPTRST